MTKEEFNKIIENDLKRLETPMAFSGNAMCTCTMYQMEKLSQLLRAAYDLLNEDPKDGQSE